MLPILLTISAFILIIGYVVIETFDDDGFLRQIYLVIVALVGVVVGVFLVCYKVEELSCEKKATAQGLEYRYDLWVGCLVKERDGNYIDYDKYRVWK